MAPKHPANLGLKFTLQPQQNWLIPFLDYRKLGDGLFLQSCAEVAQLYPKIKYENIIIDNCCMQVSKTHSLHMHLLLLNDVVIS